MCDATLGYARTHTTGGDMAKVGQRIKGTGFRIPRISEELYVQLEEIAYMVDYFSYKNLTLYSTCRQDNASYVL